MRILNESRCTLCWVVESIKEIRWKMADLGVVANLASIEESKNEANEVAKCSIEMVFNLILGPE